MSSKFVFLSANNDKGMHYKGIEDYKQQVLVRLKMVLKEVHTQQECI